MQLAEGIVSADQAKSLVTGQAEAALLDVREGGEFASGHPFFAVSLPFSRFELDLPRLVPGRHATIVLYDDGLSARAQRARKAAAALGYRDVRILGGGVS